MSDKEIFQRAYKKAINGGLSGFGAMTFQVCSLMWLRTLSIINIEMVAHS